jgi:hypothetical protein
MKRFFLAVTTVPAAALVGASLIYIVWDSLIRAEILSPSTFEWFPMVAVFWMSICILIAGGIVRLSRLRGEDDV